MDNTNRSEDQSYLLLHVNYICSAPEIFVLCGQYSVPVHVCLDFFFKFLIKKKRKWDEGNSCVTSLSSGRVTLHVTQRK